jgi:hypothetical protein
MVPKKRSILDTILTTKFYFTIKYLIFFPFILRANYCLFKSTVYETSPPCTFFGTSNWSFFVTGFYLSALYIWANVPIYCIKICDIENLGWKKRSFWRNFTSAIRGGLTPILLLTCLGAFIAGRDIWHGNEADFSSEWTIMYIHYISFYAYLIINLIDILIKFKTRIKEI